YVVSNMAPAEEACRLYETRFRIERVSTHMTKGGGFPLRARGHDRADVPWASGDDATSHQAFAQGSAWRNGQRLPRRPETVAEGRAALGQRGHLALGWRLRRHRAPWRGQARGGGGHLL